MELPAVPVREGGDGEDWKEHRPEEREEYRRFSQETGFYWEIADSQLQTFPLTGVYVKSV